MAKITPGPLAGVVSGKIGNTVFSRGRYGPYIRNRMIPTSSQSTATLDVRNRLSALSKAWGAVAAASKVAWKTWAATNPVIDRLGASQVLSANAAFIQLNAHAIQAGGTQISLPPVGTSPIGLLGLNITVDIGVTPECLLKWTSGATGAAEVVAVWAAVVDSPGRAYYKNLLKLVHLSGVAQATDLEIAAALASRFGTLIVGQVVYIEAEVWSRTTGLISGRAACSDVVEAPA
jgi:hypothetical protein